MEPNPRNVLGRLLLAQSGATRLSSICSVVVTALCWGPAFLILFTRLRDELSYLPHILIAVGALSLLKILWRGIESIACYEHGVIVRRFLQSRTILHSDIAGVEFLAVSKLPLRDLWRDNISLRDYSARWKSSEGSNLGFQTRWSKNREHRSVNPYRKSWCPASQDQRRWQLQLTLGE